MENAWTVQLKNTLAQHEDNGLSEKEMRFYHVDKLYGMAKHTGGFASSCATCLAHKVDIEQIVEELPQYLDGTNTNRQRYEEQYDAIEKHLKREHGLATPLQAQYIHLMVGMVVGAALGYVVSFAINPNSIQFFVFIGWFLGTATGQIMGKRKEKWLKNEGKYIS